jgi:hypothetical protein
MCMVNEPTQGSAPAAAPSTTTVLTQPSAPAPAGSAAPAPAAAPSWRDQLEEGIRSDPSLSHIQDIGSLAKSYVNAQKMIGADKIAVPSKHATPEDWQGVFRKLGLPETVDKYELEAPKDSDPELIKGFKDIAHKNGILPKQAGELLKFYQGINDKAKADIQAQQTQAVEAGVKELRTEWGDHYDHEVLNAKAALKRFGDDKLNQWLEESGAGNSPHVIRLLNRMGKTLGEDQLRGVGGGVAITPAIAQGKINTIMGDKSHPYNDATHPNHQQAVEEMSALYQGLYSAG